MSNISAGSTVALLPYDEDGFEGTNWESWMSQFIGMHVVTKGSQRVNRTGRDFVVLDLSGVADVQTRSEIGDDLEHVYWRVSAVDYQCGETYDAHSFDCHHCMKASKCAAGFNHCPPGGEAVVNERVHPTWDRTEEELAAIGGARNHLTRKPIRPEVRSHLIARSYPIGGLPKTKPCGVVIANVSGVRRSSHRTSSDREQWSETVDLISAENNRTYYGSLEGVEMRRQALDAEREEILCALREKDPEPNPMRSFQAWLNRPMGGR